MIADGLLRRFMPSFEVWEHELTHALVGLLFGIIPVKIVVKKGEGGIVRHKIYTPDCLYPLAIDFVSLAPYVLPTITFLMVVFRPIIHRDTISCYDFFIGLSFGYHILSTIREFKSSWTLKKFPSADTGELINSDIAKTGIIFSTIYICTVTLAIHGVMLAIMIKGYTGIKGWAIHVWEPTIKLLASIASTLVR